MFPVSLAGIAIVHRIRPVGGPVKVYVLYISHSIVKRDGLNSGFALGRRHVRGPAVRRDMAHKSNGPSIPGRLNWNEAVAVVELLADILLLSNVSNLRSVKPRAPDIAAGVGPVLYLEDFSFVSGWQIRVPAAIERRHLRILHGKLLWEVPRPVSVWWRHIVLVGLVHLPSIGVHHQASENPLLRRQRLLVIQVRRHICVGLGGRVVLQVHPVARNHHNVPGLFFAGHSIGLQVLPGKPVVIGTQQPASQAYFAVCVGTAHQVARPR